MSRIYIILSCFLLLLFSKTPAQQGLFDSEEVLQLQLKGSLRGLLNDRSSIPKNFPLVLSINKEDSSQLAIPAGKNKRTFPQVEGKLLLSASGNSFFKERHTAVFCF